MVLLAYDRYQRLLSKEDTLNTNEPVQPNVSEAEPSVAIEQHIETRDDTSGTSLNTDTDSDTLLQHFPKASRNRVRTILNYIRPLVKWNDRGEVTIEEREIPGSNIVDLIKVYIKDYKDFHPPGRDAFGELLLKVNVPKSVLSSSARPQLGKGLIPRPPGIPPPPGIPLKRKVRPFPVNTVKWLRL